MIVAFVALKGGRVHGDELGVGLLEELALSSEFGESFLHGLAGGHAGRVGIQLGFLLYSCCIGFGPLPMHVQGTFHAGEIHGVGTVDRPGEFRHVGDRCTMSLEYGGIEYGFTTAPCKVCIDLN